MAKLPASVRLWIQIVLRQKSHSSISFSSWVDLRHFCRLTFTDLFHCLLPCSTHERNRQFHGVKNFEELSRSFDLQKSIEQLLLKVHALVTPPFLPPFFFSASLPAFQCRGLVCTQGFQLPHRDNLHMLSYGFSSSQWEFSGIVCQPISRDLTWLQASWKGRVACMGLLAWMPQPVASAAIWGTWWTPAGERDYLHMTQSGLLHKWLPPVWLGFP